MIPTESESDLPSPPGYPLPIGEERSVERGTQDLRFTDPSGTTEHVPQSCECKLCMRSPVLLASQTPVHEIAGGHQAPWQEIPSPPAQAYTSTTPLSSLSLSQGTMDPPPVTNITPSSFLDLVVILTELWAETGESEFRFSNIIPLLREKCPNAYASVGVENFKDYVTLAISHGVVKIRGTTQSDGWVSLSNPKSRGPKPASTLSPQPSRWPGDGMFAARSSSVSWRGGGVDSKFVDLVEVLGELWRSGKDAPPFSTIALQIVRDERTKARTLGACGVDKFKAYLELAKEAGIIEIYYGRPGGERVSLDRKVRERAGYV